MAWEPPFLNGQLATSPCGGSNCLVWSGARSVERDSKGSISAVTGDIRRHISGTTCGGTTLAQVAAAVWDLYGVVLTIRYSLPWADFLTLIAAGRGAATYIGYAAMHGSGFDSFPSFNGGHGVYVGELSPDGTRALVYDPGADGRYSGIPKGPQWWPLELLKKAAGAMPAGSGTVGYGYVSAAFTRDTEEEADVPLNADTQDPPLLTDIAPTNLYDDEACTVVAQRGANWPGAPAVGCYAGALTPATKSRPIRWSPSPGVWKQSYAPIGATSNVVVNPKFLPPNADTTAAYNAGVDAASEFAKKAKKP